MVVSCLLLASYRLQLSTTIYPLRSKASERANLAQEPPIVLVCVAVAIHLLAISILGRVVRAAIVQAARRLLEME